jgi:hypothetical protein
MTSDSPEQTAIPPRSGEYTGPSPLNYWARPAFAFAAPFIFIFVISRFEIGALVFLREWKGLLLTAGIGLFIALPTLLLSRSFARSVRWDESSLEVSWPTGMPKIIRWEELVGVRTAESQASNGLPLILGTAGENTWVKTGDGAKFTINSAFLQYAELKAILQARVERN